MVNNVLVNWMSSRIFVKCVVSVFVQCDTQRIERVLGISALLSLRVRKTQTHAFVVMMIYYNFSMGMYSDI